VIEIGCYKGESTAKFSHICKMQGFKLYVFDFFDGVENLSKALKGLEYDISREYAVSEDLVWSYLIKYGIFNICKTFKG
jgi:hypothetical protein